MLVEDVAALYKVWVEESSSAWHNGVFKTFLEQGYNMFRQRVIRMSAFMYATSVNITPIGAVYDLVTGVPSVLGLAPSATKMERVLELRYTESDTVDGVAIQLVQSPHQLARVVGIAACIRDGKIQFNSEPGSELRLWYLPASTIDWTKTVIGDNEFIDDLDPFHALIAVYAAEFYGVRDGMVPPIQRIKATLEEDLENFLMRYQGDSLTMGSEY